MVDTVDVAERRRDDAATRHALAMEAIGLIRTALHLQYPVFTGLINASEVAGHRDGLDATGQKSFDLQVRMAKAAITFMHQLDALADETIELMIAEREK
jgi:hypothetical protein